MERNLETNIGVVNFNTNGKQVENKTSNQNIIQSGQPAQSNTQTNTQSKQMDFESNTLNYFESKKFKFSESNTFEYKQSIESSNFAKYIETICAFLNSKGGYLIFGITNDLIPIGLSTSNDELDKFVLRVDNIISTNKIIGKNNDTDQIVKLNSTNLTTQMITNSKKKKFIIIKIVPTPNTLYQIDSGKIYYRLGASNYHDKNERFYKQSELEHEIKQSEEKFKAENKKNIDMFQQSIVKYENQIDERNKVISDLENKIIRYKNDLEAVTRDKEELDEKYNLIVENTWQKWLVTNVFTKIPCVPKKYLEQIIGFKNFK